MAYMASGLCKRLSTSTSTKVPKGTSPAQGTTSSMILAKPHWSRRADNTGKAPTATVSKRVEASMLFSLAKHPVAYQGWFIFSCGPRQTISGGAEREEFGYQPHALTDAFPSAPGRNLRG